MTQSKTLQLMIPREIAQEIPANQEPLPTAAIFSQLKSRKGTSPEELSRAVPPVPRGQK